ncbi:MAG: Rv2175c family DNA-binding protein [Actinomycetes bacterium]
MPEDTAVESLVTDWLTLPEVADLMEVPVSRVRQLVTDRQMLAVRRGENRALAIPADFVQDGKVLKGLPGTLTLLADARYTDDEALRWLFSPDDSLPGSPVEALVANRGTEVKRRAQALGF